MANQNYVPVLPVHLLMVKWIRYKLNTHQYASWGGYFLKGITSDVYVTVWQEKDLQALYDNLRHEIPWKPNGYKPTKEIKHE